MPIFTACCIGNPCRHPVAAWAAGGDDLLGIQRGWTLGVANWSVYSATKFAVVGFHDALRKELGEEGIRVAVIEPGAARTEFGANVADAMAECWAKLDAMTWRRHWSTPSRSRRACWWRRFYSAL